MTAKKAVSSDTAIMERIIAEPIPEKGRLSNPVTKTSRKQISLTDLDIDVKPSRSNRNPDLQTWNSRQFVDFFAECYQEVLGAFYRKGYKSDCVVFQDIMNFFHSNGLPKGEWTHKFINWSFEPTNRNRIVRTRGYITPTDIRAFLNHFYQETVMPQVEAGEVERITTDTSLIDQITKAMNEGRERQVFVDFGIPVTATYMVKIKKFKVEIVQQAITQLLTNLSKGDLADREKLHKILHASIVGSPYPAEFELLNWRDRFDQIVKPYHKEDWWRDVDYKAKPMPKYLAFLAE